MCVARSEKNKFFSLATLAHGMQGAGEVSREYMERRKTFSDVFESDEEKVEKVYCSCKERTEQYELCIVREHRSP